MGEVEENWAALVEEAPEMETVSQNVIAVIKTDQIHLLDAVPGALVHISSQRKALKDGQAQRASRTNAPNISGSDTMTFSPSLPLGEPFRKLFFRNTASHRKGN